MKKRLWHITLAAVVTLVIYIASYMIIGAVMVSIENKFTANIILAVVTTAAYAAMLLYISKARNEAGETEVLADYKDKTYTGIFDDIKLIIKREALTLICIGVMVILCAVLNGIDSAVFGKKTISFPTFIYAAMCIFEVPFGTFGYIVSIVAIWIMYIFGLLIYRKKLYEHWMKK